MNKQFWLLYRHALTVLILAMCMVFNAATSAASVSATTKDVDLNEGSKLLTSGVRVATAQTVWQVQSRDARQAVAVDATHVFAISNHRISKVDKVSGKTLLRWSAVGSDSPVRHLNSAVVVGDRIYAAHSNWPVTPAHNSIEVWNAANLVSEKSINMPGVRTWITWVDWYRDNWWVVLAQYDPAVTRPHDSLIVSTRDLANDQSHDMPNVPLDQRTRLLRMDAQFRVLETWYFPIALLHELDPMSNSGGSWGPDGKLWLTGHSQQRAYLVRLPATGNTLEWTSTVVLPDIEGQGIAWDRYTGTPVLFGVRRSKRELVKMRITLSGE